MNRMQIKTTTVVDNDKKREKNKVVWRVSDVCGNTEIEKSWKTEEKQCGDWLRRVIQRKCMYKLTGDRLIAQLDKSIAMPPTYHVQHYDYHSYNFFHSHQHTNHYYHYYLIIDHY